MRRSVENYIQPYQFEPPARTPSSGPVASRLRAVAGRRGPQGLVHPDGAALVARSGGPARNWCTCGDCQQMDEDEDCICCNEIELTNIKRQDNLCVGELEELQYIVLYKPALNILRHNKIKFSNDIKKKAKLKSDAVTNNVWRYLAYCQYFIWLSPGKNLGKGIRVTIPSCVVKKIRKSFPEPSNIYTGFKLMQ